MMITEQHTLNAEIELSGIGLHTGKFAKIILKPAPPNTGVKFIRVDLAEKPCIEALVTNVIDVEREVILGKNDVKIHTVEHLLATLSAFSIDNVIIEIDGPEVPILDGSAKLIVEAIKKVGVKNQYKPRKIFRIKEPMSITKDETLLILLPSAVPKITCTINFKHKILGAQHLTLPINQEVFVNELAAARTFGFEKEVEYLRSRGLIKGGSLENAIVIGEDKILNPEGLRYPDEFVRHKMLDLIGDFSLLGAQLCAHIIAIRSGHEANVSIVNKVLQLYKRTYSGMKSFLNINENDDMLDIRRIMEVLPHRYPMLLVDRIIGIEGERRIVGLKNVTINEDFFNGHWPGAPVMPGVLIIEALAQLSGVMLLRKSENLGKLPYFMGLDNVKWRYPVTPGDQLIMEVETLKIGTRRGSLKGCAYVEGKLVCEAEFKFSLIRD
ncbi:MAG TPA: bifunctional UDP-3-O-[3-hydroxymyristoyl] N-acetylglucosamine deacetylase/3-hydroxyacyl-ACP dehydratase [bacterium]|nr:bifunctional UDP-3-O-[3-hydroxymyristoyl] N-acetylglucosamine deacetylase/3-hydroxyacyl-ACP dehydratase [bacterium]